MEAAKPTQTVLTSGPTCLIVSKTAMPAEQQIVNNALDTRTRACLLLGHFEYDYRAMRARGLLEHC